MKSTQFHFRTLALSLLFAGSLAHAATITGTVTNKTTSKPSAGDTVVLVDPMAGMAVVGKTTTDARGHYSLQKQGDGPALVKATHQGAEYFIEAPKGGAPGDLSVFDVASKVQGVFIEADVIEVETENGQLKVTERYFVHNTSTPPTTQWSDHSFEVNIPPDATVDGVGGQRPNGLPTNVKMEPFGAKGHYAFNFPIQPDDGEKETLFQLAYHVPYSSGKVTLHAEVSLPADNVAVLMPKSMTFTPGSGTTFKSVPEDPGVQTWLIKNAPANKPIEFTIAGTGNMPREQQGAAAGGPAGGAGMGAGAPDAGGAAPDAAGTEANGKPGGGIGPPVSGTEPLTKYKWWILGALALLLVAAAAFLLRKPSGFPATGAVADASVAAHPASGAYAASAAYPAIASPASKNAALLNALKEEMFALESERISGTLTPEDYAETKAALEIVLKRALKRTS